MYLSPTTVKQTIASVAAVLLVCCGTGRGVSGYVLENGVVIGSEDPGKSITCWTCPNKTNNEECNDWAPDLACPKNHTVCKTVHRLHVSSGRSITVNKQCTKEKDCDLGTVGCHSTGVPGVMDCVSCCNRAYCNEAVPTNHSNALQLSTLESSSGVTLSSSLAHVVVCTVSVFLTNSLRTFWWSSEVFSR